MNYANLIRPKVANFWGTLGLLNEIAKSLKSPFHRYERLIFAKIAKKKK